MARNQPPPPPPPGAGLMDEIRKIPPVTRTLVGSTVVVSIPVMLQLVSPYKILFVWKLVKGGQLWRIPTSFFFGGTGFGFIFDLVMLYRSSNTLESVWYSRRSADYAWQLTLACTAILGLNIPLNTYVHYRALLSCITYLGSRLNPDAMVSILGLLTVKAIYFPFALLAMDLIQAGPQAAMVSLTGVMVGHLWYILEWQERGPTRPGGGRGAVLGSAPGWLQRLLGRESEPAGGDARPYGSAFNPRGTTSANVSAAGGHSWGRGQRLGEE